MTQQPRHLQVADAVHSHLGSESFEAISLTDKGKYQTWYATLLSTVALIAGEQNVVYAQTDYAPPMDLVRIVVFTSSLVIVARIDPTADGVPTAQAVGRRSLVSVKLSASERIDSHDQRAHDWPGTLNLVLTYRDLADPVEIVASGRSRYRVDRPEPIVTFVESLSADLST